MGELIYRTSRDVKRAWWAKALIRSKQERFQNGMTVAEWCKQYKVSEKSYWYYHKLLGDELVRLANEQEEPLVPVAAQNTCDNMPVFTELTIPKEDGADKSGSVPAVICKGDLRIEISDLITDELLIRIMEALSHV